MGELVAWGLGLGLGYVARNSLITRWRISIFAFAVLLLGILITVLSGEMFEEPWLVFCRCRSGCGGRVNRRHCLAVRPSLAPTGRAAGSTLSARG